MKTLRIYSKPNCTYCEQAKAYLKKNDIVYEEINVEIEPGVRDWLISRGQRKLPVFTIDGVITFQGGWDTLKTVRKDEIMGMLK